MRKILFTARDAGAAHQIKAIIPVFKRSGFGVSLVASDAAFDILDKAGLGPQRFRLSNGTGFARRRGGKRYLKELLDKTKDIIITEKPAAVFSGLTTIDYGIDEAALYWACPERSAFPSFQFLDSWGTFNRLQGAHPCLYFGIDEDFKDLGKKAAGAPIEIVGSPKHFCYASLPIAGLRDRTRKALGVGKGEDLVGYFGQLPDVPGHYFNFRLLADAVRRYGDISQKICRFMIRPHPAYAEKFGPYWRYSKRIGLAAIDAENRFPIEALVSACDIVATCYSTVAIDNAYLNRYAKRPLGVSLNIICGKGMKGYMRRNFGYIKSPLVRRGIGYCVGEPAEMPRTLATILDGQGARTGYFKATKSIPEGDPCRKIIKAVLRFLG